MTSTTERLANTPNHDCVLIGKDGKCELCRRDNEIASLVVQLRQAHDRAEGAERRLVEAGTPSPPERARPLGGLSLDDLEELES